LGEIAAQLEGKIARGEARVGTLGLGYVGLPLSVEFASAGLSVVGFDLAAEKTAAINRGESYVQDVPAERVAALVRAGRLSATGDFGALADCDAVVICVPTPLSKTKDPDLSMVVDAARAIAARLRPAQLVVLESTTYPGTTEELILPILAERGLAVGDSFFLAFSPERGTRGTRASTRGTPRRSSAGSRRPARAWPARSTRRPWTP
jgi:UDP-N-acetyl-D-glucosamine dehydrogenase